MLNIRNIIFGGSYMLLMLIHFCVSAQTASLTPSLENVIPPAPNAAALNKFGNMPIGQSTGIPSVSVPIYAWAGKNFGKQINISLNYHLGGIKVDETASNVGLGWALNAGGVVSRTVRGVYDELPGDGFLYKQMPVNNNEGNNYGLIANNERTFYRMNAGLVDTQNDIFNYSFNGQSGRFVLGKNGDILFLEQTKIKVEKFTDIINGKPLFSKFIITDEYGYKYVFEDYELSVRVNGSGWNSSYTSSWYLSKIYNPTNNDSIDFSYDNVSFRNEYGVSATDAIPLYNDGVGFPASMGGGSSVDVFGKRLRKITFPDGNVADFYYQSAMRQDLYGDYLLQKVKMSKGDASFGYLLSHDYSLAGRATLLSVTPIGGASEIQDKPYTFEYFNGAVLPPKFSVQQDHWGYYNFNQGSFIPKEYLIAPNGQYGNFREFQGGNRDTDPTRVKAGSMVKMSYPTGGSTVFDMEANRAKDNWLEQNETVTTTLPPYSYQNTTISVSSDNYPSGTQTFLFQGENSTSTNFDITINPLGGSCSSGCSITFEIYNASNGLISTQQINFTDPSPDPYHITKSFSLSGLVKNQTYTIKAYTANLSGYNDYAQINWRETNAGGTSTITLTHVQEFVGGLRAKKVSDFTDNGTQLAQVKEYEYLNEDGTSSGALGFKPVYSYMVKYEYEEDPEIFHEPSYQGNFNYNYIIRTSSSINDIAYANGSPVTYKRVVEKTTSNGNSIGKTVRNFTSFQDYAPIVQDIFPSVPTEYASWSYGLLKKEEIYNASNQLLKKTENTYAFGVDDYYNQDGRVENFRSISIAPVKFMWVDTALTIPHIVPTADPHYFLMSSFTPFAGRAELTQSVTTDFHPGQADLVTTTSNTYDQSEFYLKESKIVNSKNEERKTVIEYTKDRAISGPNAAVFSVMYSRNMIKNIVGERQFLNNDQIIYQRKDFADWGGNVYAPSIIYSQRLSETEEARIRFLNYDSHGTGVSVKQEGGAPMCYIWGYGGDYLVAKVSNADYAAVLAVLGGTQAVEDFRNDKNPSDAAVETIGNTLRANLPSAQVESFTYNTLLGMTSHTDMKGLKNSYEYDVFGRLRYVKDQNQNIVKSNIYHYKN